MYYDRLMRVPFPDGVQLVGFADDKALIITKHTTEKIECVARMVLKVVAGWMIDHGLKLSANKTEEAMLTKKRSYRTLQLDIRGYSLLVKKSVKYLGVILDSRLSFTRHMVEVAGKAFKTATEADRVINSLGGLKIAKQRLLSTVVKNKLMYMAPGRKYSLNKGALQKA